MLSFMFLNIHCALVVKRWAGKFAHFAFCECEGARWSCRWRGSGVWLKTKYSCKWKAKSYKYFLLMLNSYGSPAYVECATLKHIFQIHIVVMVHELTFSIYALFIIPLVQCFLELKRNLDKWGKRKCIVQ